MEGSLLKLYRFVWIPVLGGILSSCAVHIGNAVFDVPWWCIGVPTALVVVLSLYFTGKAVSEREYVCGFCGAHFSPKRRDMGFLLHDNDRYVLKCPHCKKRGFCEPSYKNK